MKVAIPVSGQQRIERAFQTASATTGISFDYLVKTAVRESNMDPDAAAETSSAAGTFQFIESTWLETVKEAGARFGLKSYADLIERNSRGQLEVRDPAARQAVLDLRHNPEVSVLMAGALTEKNAQTLENFLGRPPTDGELYIAHFLGVGGAKRLLGLVNTRPGEAAADHFKAQANANRSIFYDGNGRARSSQAVYQNLVNRHDGVQMIGSALASVQPKPKPEGAAVPVPPVPGSQLAAAVATPRSKPEIGGGPLDRVARAWNVMAATDDHQGVAAALRIAADTAGPGNRFDQAFGKADAAARQARSAMTMANAKDREPVAAAPVRSARVAGNTAIDSAPLPGAAERAGARVAFRAVQPKTAFDSLYRTDPLAPRDPMGGTMAVAFAGKTSLFSPTGSDPIDSVFAFDRSSPGGEAAPQDQRQPGLPLDLGRYRRLPPADEKREVLPPV